MSGDDVPREVLDLLHETDGLRARIVRDRRWPANPADWKRTVIDYLVKLTRLPPLDGLDLKRATGKGLGGGRNWLLKPARLWDELLHNSTRNGIGGSDMEVLFGPVIRVDAKTNLLVVFGHDDPFRLVWPEGENFGYRLLWPDESKVVSLWFLSVVRKFGFVDMTWPMNADRLGNDPKPKRPPRHRRSKPPGQPD